MMRLDTVYYRKSKRSDASRLAPNLRKSDVDEIWAAGGRTPQESLEAGLELSDLAYSMVCRDKIICMGGVAPMPSCPSLGIAWLLASDELPKYARVFHCLVPEAIEKMHTLYPSLGNWVDARNTTSARWLKRLGFTLVGTNDHYGVAGIPFHWFVKTKEQGGICVT